MTETSRERRRSFTHNTRKGYRERSFSQNGRQSSSNGCRSCKCSNCTEQREKVHKLINKQNDTDVQGSLQCRNSCCKGREYNVKFCQSEEIAVDEEILTFLVQN